MYSLLRHALFTLDPETAHHVTLSALNFCPTVCLPNVVDNPFSLWGYTFPNRIGLAAGLDKNGDYLKGLAKLGFGFIEIGTVTPKPQIGNPLPRLFRLPAHQALINRMGFNNNGVDYLVEQVRKAKYNGILGINIGKNATTSNEDALKDYQYCLEKVYPFASYVVVNISSPNTPGLRDLQEGHLLHQLLEPLKRQQQTLAEQHHQYKPLIVKIAPDLSKEAIKHFAEVALSLGIEGIIATNTSNQRPGLDNVPLANETGGLSGAPITALADDVLATLFSEVGNAIPLIGVGGIMNAEDGNRKFAAGASLVQVYTGLIYHGPRLIRELSLLNS